MTSNIRFRGDLSRVNEEEKGFINKKLEKFVEKYASHFTDFYVNVAFELQKETSRGRAMHHCQVLVETEKGKFPAENQDFSAEKSLHGALDKVERQMGKHFQRN